jgi:hypothetical protein
MKITQASPAESRHEIMARSANRRGYSWSRKRLSVEIVSGLTCFPGCIRFRMV